MYEAAAQQQTTCDGVIMLRLLILNLAFVYYSGFNYQS